MATTKITEAENLLRKENVNRYMDLYGLKRGETENVLKAYAQAKDALELCGGGDALQLDTLFKSAGGKLKVDRDSVGGEMTGKTQTNEEQVAKEAAKKREDERAVLEEAKEKLHGGD